MSHRDSVLDDNPLWYRAAIICQLHVKAFADSDADGMGDFRGLMGHLEYLQQLGNLRPEDAAYFGDGDESSTSISLCGESRCCCGNVSVRESGSKRCSNGSRAVRKRTCRDIFSEKGPENGGSHLHVVCYAHGGHVHGPCREEVALTGTGARNRDRLSATLLRDATR